MAVAKWTKFSKQELETMIQESNSYADFAEKMGYSRIGGSGIRTAKEVIDKYALDISHFGVTNSVFDYNRFKYGNAIKPANMLDALISLRGHKCECCGNIEWLGQPIVLEVHHKDGDHLNNVLENLDLLCPNCHSLTENWRGKNIASKKDIITDEQFIQALQEHTSIRQALISLGLTAAGGNYTRAYELIYQHQIKHLMK